MNSRGERKPTPPPVEEEEVRLFSEIERKKRRRRKRKREKRDKERSARQRGEKAGNGERSTPWKGKPRNARNFQPLGRCYFLALSKASLQMLLATTALLLASSTLNALSSRTFANDGDDARQTPRSGTLLTNPTCKSLEHLRSLLNSCTFVTESSKRAIEHTAPHHDF